MTGHRKFVLARAMLGAYLVLHFAMLVPYATEVFSSAGMLPDAAQSPLSHAFPNVLSCWDTPPFVVSFVAFGAVCGALLGAGLWPRIAALGAYYVWACLVGRNPLIANPSIPYVGLLLLVCGAIGSKREHDGCFPARARALLWIAMALGYSYSGLTKLGSPSWMDGTALVHLLEGPLARPTTLREALLSLNPSLLSVATYGVLGLELSFAPLACVKALRPLLWSSLLSLHLALIALMQFADLSAGMVLLHAFTIPGATSASWGRSANMPCGDSPHLAFSSVWRK